MYYFAVLETGIQIEVSAELVPAKRRGEGGVPGLSPHFLYFPFHTVFSFCVCLSLSFFFLQGHQLCFIKAHPSDLIIFVKTLPPNEATF